jgi:4-diphosphocytidyl-2-C-methyl-D-erythritol kinase
MRNVIRIKTPAKINLYLRVLGRRPDGYHELDTLFQAIDIKDELILRKTSGKTTLEAPGRPDLETEDNLILKALSRLEHETGEALNLHVRLIKRIPTAGGLGGGSSDAAAALLGARELFDLPVDDERLLIAATQLGADVPFFLKGGAAVGRGVGEILTPVEITQDYGVALINPGFPVSTARVFQEYSSTLTETDDRGTVWGLLAGEGGFERLLHNDLQRTTERLYPEVKGIRRFFMRLGVRGALMSGSGPTVFGILESGTNMAVHIKEAAAPQWTVMVTTPLKSGPEVD